MADNVTIPATGSGTATPVIATDDVAGVQFQKIKLDVGGDGASVPLPVGAGTVATVPRVTLGSDDPAVVALQVLDNAISGSEMQVDVVAALPAGTNAIGVVSTKTALTASAPTNVTVNGTSAAAVAVNASRKGLILRNTSTAGQRISLHLAAGAAVLNDGVTLDVGDVFEMGEYDFTTAAISAIASAASGRLSVQEFT